MTSPVSSRASCLLLLILAGCFSSETLAQAPANDQFANAAVLAGVFGNSSGTNVDATLEVDEPATTDGSAAEGSVWFQWVAPASGEFVFRLTADFDSQVAVYTGAAVNDLIPVGENDTSGTGGDSVTIATIEGQTYGVRITGATSQNGSFMLNWSANPVYEKVPIFSGEQVGSASNNGTRPGAGLVQGIDGSFYGTTYSGGASDNGTVFKMTPGGVLTTLVNFTGANGSSPFGALVQGSDGNFYGTTSVGGAVDAGTVFKMTPAGALTTLVEFNSTNGWEPRAALVEGNDGNFYGTTLFGGAARVGTVFKMTPAGVLTTLVDFTGANGGSPHAALVQGRDGNLYGTSTQLDHLGNGSVFRLIFPGLPDVIHLHPDGLTTTSVIPQSKVNPRGAATSVSLEFSSDGESFDSIPISLRLGGYQSLLVGSSLNNLTPGTTYYYRFRATNSFGETLGPVQSVSTLAAPIVGIAEPSELTPTSARLHGTINARNHDASVYFEWGTDGNSFPNTAEATPGIVTGNTSLPVITNIAGLVKGTTYHYRIRATGPGGTGYSNSSTFSLSVLSGLNQDFPVPPPATTGTVTVNFDPVETGAWRFAGEGVWRTSGEPADHLAGGPRVVEYLPVPGFIHPPEETVDVINGGDVVLERSYFATQSTGTGTLTVNLKPDELASATDEATRAQWRLVGQAEWLDSGAHPGGLPPGGYEVECKPLTGRITPPTSTVTIPAGGSPELTLTYFVVNTPTGSAPLAVDFADVTENEDLPYAYVGQIRSRVGTSTGFVVKRRVVATAGHVVFDDGTLSDIGELEWILQRHAGEYEPRPQVPRGYYLAAGYATQRVADGSPGEGSHLSQDLDFAALYFLEEAARGGYGGYLASELGDENEFLDSTAEKILSGYAVDGVPTEDRGKLHATPPFTAALSPAYGETWTTQAVHGLGGCSGGPLFVRHTNSFYYPAAIYLGGSNQTVVRAIDPHVVDLFLRAEQSGNGGGNNTSGGVTHTNSTALGSATQPGSITILIEPAKAREHPDAGWWLEGPLITSAKRHGESRGGLNAGDYVLKMVPLPGFRAPEDESVQVVVGNGRTFTYTYDVILTPIEEWRQLHFETTDNTGDAADDADPDGDARPNIDEFTAGTDPNDAAAFFTAKPGELDGDSFSVTTEGKAGRVYELEVADDLPGGAWTRVATEGPLLVDGEVNLIDANVTSDAAFYRVRVTNP